MLVLTRRRHESIHIANDIVVTLLEIRGQQVRIGIDAPPSARIVRAELRRRTPMQLRRRPFKPRG